MGRAKKWSYEEIKKLRETYSKTSIIELEKIFDRSRDGILQKANRLGIKADWNYHRSPKWGNPLENPYINLTPHEQGYIAGLIDGEGHIEITIDPWWRTQITIANTDKKMVLWLMEKMGGRVYERHNKRHPSYKASFVWVLCGNVKTKHLLTLLLPYLITKKGKATELVNHKSRYDSL